MILAKSLVLPKIHSKAKLLVNAVFGWLVFLKIPLNNHSSCGIKAHNQMGIIVRPSVTGRLTYSV